MLVSDRAMSKGSTKRETEHLKKVEMSIFQLVFSYHEKTNDGRCVYHSNEVSYCLNIGPGHFKRTRKDF